MPCCTSFAVILPMEVVLPAPLTPTTRITNGLVVSGISRGTSTGCMISRMTSSSAGYSASVSVMRSRQIMLSSAAMIFMLVSTPTSARISSSSSSSRVCWSIFFPAPNRPERPPDNDCRVRDRLARRRENILGLLLSIIRSSEYSIVPFPAMLNEVLKSISH